MDVGLTERLVVDKHLAGRNPDAVAGNPDDTLHVVFAGLLGFVRTWKLKD